MKIILWLGICITTMMFSAVTHAEQNNKKSASDVLIYSTIQPSYWEIYLLEHGKAKQLTEGPHLNYNPTFSPDGKWLVFTSEQTGTGYLYVLALDEPNAVPTRLTKGDSFEDAAAFSPDGKTLFFVGTRDGTANIFKMPFSPGKTIAQAQAINLTKNNSGNFNPAISPDGNWIAFSSNRNSPTLLITNPQPPDNYRAANIYVMKADGTQVKKLTDYKNWEGSPVWSADGKDIYFYRVNNEIPRIYKMNKSGENISPISPVNRPALSPALFAENRIVFTEKVNDKWVIASVKSDGSDHRLEMDAKSSTWAPAYDANTKRLVVYGEAPQQKDVFYAEVPDGPYMTKPMGIGPFFVNKKMLQTQPDKTLDAYAVRGYFPNYLKKLKKVVSVKEFSKVVLSNLDGTEMKEVYHADNGFMIGLTATENDQWLATAIGMPFAARDTANLWKFKIDGSNPINLNKDDKSNNTFPRFTPDGKHIVYRSTQEGSKNIYVMDVNGKNVKRLTFENSVDTMPAVSPSGDKIIFSSSRNGENYRIYLLDLKPNGIPGKLTKLTDGPGADVHPTFSPDGKWIAYASERGGLKDETPLNPIFSPQSYGDVYIMRLSDKKIVPITDNKWEDSLPFWSEE